VSATFEQFDASDVRDLITEFPLAWVCAADARADLASLLPLLGAYDDAGELTHLIGHMARHNPLFAALTADPHALILFRGPEAYVSPEHAGTRDWAPTWNYAQLRVEVDVIFEPDETVTALDLLVDAMEEGRNEPWTAAELGARYVPMQRMIIAFRARVKKVGGKFKLGQDEAPATLRAMLENIPDEPTVRWMRRFAARRG
jgi:transcriptional regulator